MMFNKRIGVFCVSVALTSCTSGNSAIEPPFKSVNTLDNKLTVAVGTANFEGATTGLNVVVGFRQANGGSATLVNTPTLQGPAGFVVPRVKSAGVDAGTNSITGAPQSQQPGGTVTNDTFGQAGGAFSYGFAPLNASNQAINGNNGYSPYPQPLYPEVASIKTPPIFVGGPPAYGNVRTGTYPSGFDGYSQGFDIFAGTTLATGAYTLTLTVPTSPTTNGMVSAASNLSSTTALPTFPAPIAVDDGKNGANITLAIPAGVTETIVDVVDTGADPSATAPVACHGSYTAPYYYTVVDHTAGPATVLVNLPGTVGPISPITGSPTPTLCAGDDYTVFAVGVDYRAYESGPGQPDPAGIAQAPNFLTGPQSDITVSAPGGSTSGIYGQSIGRSRAIKR